jgi:hypothetical protein
MKNNITYMLISALILVALPACCGSNKNKSTKANEVTLNNAVDSISIHEINETSAQQDNASVIEETHTENINKF